jgi:gluconolactonase
MTPAPTSLCDTPPWRLLSIFLLMLCGFCIATAQSPVPPGAVVEKLATGFVFVEGPVWNDSLGLLFSDMTGNKVYRWTQGTGAVAFLNPSSNANGLAYDRTGRLLLAQTGLRRVARLDSAGSLTSLAALYGGKKLNSPNDIAVKSDGSIFFTDPPFNIPNGQQQELSFSGIYRINTAGTLQLLDSTLKLPNGICFSRDERKLYVDESQQRIIYVWDVVDDSVLANKRVFASIPPTGYADGMKIDSAGNLYCAGPLGIWVFGPNGTILDTILVAETPSNCNWGDAGRTTLYITAGKSLYRIKLATTGVRTRSWLPEQGYGLMQNYPNPFNSTTGIRIQLPGTSHVRLGVYDLLGREVALLVNEHKPPGDYTARWNADGQASGVYLCRLEAGGFTETRRMVLLR